MPYSFAFTLHGHSADVRSLSVPHGDVPLLLSASRDGSALVWGPPAQGREWDVKLRVEELEKRFVSCVAMVRHQGEAYLLIGSSSGLLSSFRLPSTASATAPDELPSPVHTLIEHRQNLCCIDTSPGGLIATGSWDKMVVVWRDFKKAFTIEGHQQAVWAVKFVGEDKLLTASADKTITLHSLSATGAKPIRSYTGHSDCVRGLAVRPDGSGFWSCGNDARVNLYAFDRAAPVRTLEGHTSFVYAVAALKDGGAVSSGEDGTVRVWSETQLVQTMPHPSISLWSVAVVSSPTGGHYIASSSSDSTIRFFTDDETLAAPQAEKDQWDKDVAERRLDKSQVGDVRHSDLPGMEALGREGKLPPFPKIYLTTGKSDGQVIMIKHNDKVEAYQWVGAERTWQQIGQVVDAIGSGRKQLFEGKEWDYVFDVDVAEGMPPLKLPYNVTENPWNAAQRFLERNELPPGYADEVVEFIHKNTGGVQLGTGAEQQQYVDPYTGASRYTGGGVGGPNAGGSRTQPSAAVQYGGGSDPFTGSSKAPTKKAGILPVKTYLSFKTFNLQAARTKIGQLDDELKSSGAAFTPDEQKVLDAIYTHIERKTAYDAQAFMDLVLRYPEAQRFPLIDLARVLALSPPLAALPSVPSLLLQSANWSEPYTPTKARDTNTLLALRAVANLFSSKEGLKQAEEAAGVLIELRREWVEVGKAKVVVATITLNYSILLVEGGKVDPSDLLNTILHIFDNETTDAETLYRTGVALGNLLTKAAGELAVGDVARAKALLDARAGEKRLKDLAAEVAAI
ncbi:hypothetical protein Q5752_003812 [Cryptotrichosporon argae]